MRPFLLMVGGPPGSGKSTLARALAPVLDASLLDLDTATGPLSALIASSQGVKDYSDAQFSGLTRNARYTTLLDLAKENLQAHQSVVVTAPFTKEACGEGIWDEFCAIARQISSFQFIWISIDQDLQLTRLKKRGETRDAEKTSSSASYSLQAPRFRPKQPTMFLEASSPLESKVASVVSRLAKPFTLVPNVPHDNIRVGSCQSAWLGEENYKKSSSARSYRWHEAPITEDCDG